MGVVDLQQAAVDDALHEGLDDVVGARPQGVAQPVGVGVDETEEGRQQRVVVVAFGHHDRDEREERLLAHHVEGAGPVQAVHPQDGGLQEDARLRGRAVQLGAVAAGDQGGAVVQGLPQQPEEPLAAAHRRQQDVLLLREARPDALDLLLHLGDQRVGDLGVDQDVVGHHADLPGAEERLGDGLGGPLHVGVLPHHDAVVAGEFEDGLLAVRDALLLEAQALLAAADVEDVVDQRVGDPAVQGLLRVAAHRVEDAGGSVELLQQRCHDVAQQPHGAQRDTARRPDHHAVAGHQGQHAQGGAGQRGVLRGVEGHHAVRLALKDQLAARVLLLDPHLLHVPAQTAGGVDLQQAAQLPAGQLHRVRLGDQHVEELVLVLDEFLAETGAEPHPPLQRDGGPVRGGGGRRLGGEVDGVVVRDRAAAHDVGVLGRLGLRVLLQGPLEAHAGEHVFQQGPPADGVDPPVTGDVLARDVEVVALQSGRCLGTLLLLGFAKHHQPFRISEFRFGCLESVFRCGWLRECAGVRGIHVRSTPIVAAESDSALTPD